MRWTPVLAVVAATVLAIYSLELIWHPRTTGEARPLVAGELPTVDQAARIRAVLPVRDRRRIGVPRPSRSCRG